MAARLGSLQRELYDAEGDGLDGAGLQWERLADAQAYVDRLLASEWFFSRWPHLVHCTVERRGRGSRWSTCLRLDGDRTETAATEGVVLVADGGLRQAVVLHELTHLVLPPATGHDWTFAQTLLTLVRHEMGLVAFAEFLHALRRQPGFRSLPLPVGGD